MRYWPHIIPLILLVALLLSACGHRDDGGYGQAKSAYSYCLQTGGDCSREREIYTLSANDRMLNQQHAGVMQQNQANTSAWARWYMDRQNAPLMCAGTHGMRRC